MPKLTLAAEEVLPRPPLDSFKAAIATFPHHTGLGVDKFPIRKLLLLTDEALETLLDILMMMELIGCLPPQHQVVMLVLLAKPTGGFRTIGLMPLAQRVWARLRRDQATEWEARWQREYFWAGKAKGAEDAAWMTAFEDEAA